jgi:hypothetical protein
MLALPAPHIQGIIALGLAAALLLGAVFYPMLLLLLLPLPVVALAVMAFYQFPVAMVVALVLTFGLGIDLQVDAGMLASLGGGAAAGALVKVVPFALAGALLLRYGPERAINWPFLTFTAIAAISIVVLPIGRVVTTGEMLRSLIGSTAPFALGFATAPRRVWSAVVRGVTFVPIISLLVGGVVHVLGLYPMFDGINRLQGMHTPPFLAGFCVTAIFAATLEYLRGFRLTWLVVGGLDLAILLATQARAPFLAVALFLALVFLLSGRKIFPLRRKVDLLMGGMVPGLLVLGPVLVLALDRFIGASDNFSGRDIIWPYFIEAIESRPLFGFGLGAGKLIVDPEDPTIRLLRSTAAHNEYLRLSVDAGIIGCAAIFLSIIAWIWGGSRTAPPAEKLVLRAALLAALVHSAFDNTLIASTAVMQFAFFAAALARAREDGRALAEQRRRQGGRRGSNAGHPAFARSG